MKHSPPPRDFPTFSNLLTRVVPRSLSDESLRQLHAHYEELARWSSRTALIGVGTIETVLERHYGESLIGLGLLDRIPTNLVDVGSGAGFPGFPLAAALPNTVAYLVDSRQRKWAFLSAACRRAGLEAVCVHGRIGKSLPAALPDGIDLLTLRAVRLPLPVWSVLLERLTERGRVLLWTGKEAPDLPVELEEQARLRLPGSTVRQIIAFSKTRTQKHG